MTKKATYVASTVLLVAVFGVATLQYRLPIGPIVLLLGLLPAVGYFSRGGLSSKRPRI